MQCAEQFKKTGYTIIRKLVGVDDVSRLYQYTIDNLKFGNLDDGQVPGSPAFYQDPEIVKLQKNLLPCIESHLQMQLLNVFCYHRVYRKGAVLRAHKDSTRAEISATINLGQEGKPWDLWFLDYDENAIAVTLEPGDALIYYGQKLTHWRAKLEDSDLVSQIMFHCVDKNGKHTSVVRAEVIRKIRKWCRERVGIRY